jgi:putative sterol carrier protein
MEIKEIKEKKIKKIKKKNKNKTEKIKKKMLKKLKKLNKQDCNDVEVIEKSSDREGDRNPVVMLVWSIADWKRAILSHHPIVYQVCGWLNYCHTANGNF